MLRPNRKQNLAEFSADKNIFSIILLAALFLVGLTISFKYGLLCLIIYLLLWAVSYAIIYAGTCRYCVYYGKKCPIPLEGSCVHKFFKKKDTGFGWARILWATFVYLLRILVPLVIIIRDSLLVWGLSYTGTLVTFAMVHLWITGCPNCINIECPLNPDYSNNLP